MVGELELVKVIGEKILSVYACEIDVIEGGGVIGRSRAHEAFKIIDGVVMRRQKEKLGAFLTEVDTASGEIRDNGCYANHVEEGGSLHVIGLKEGFQ